ncbi:MAG: hypothetical protein WD118_01455 [Phycisphaeraceae bacterium]
MADAKARHDWDQAAPILTVLANANRDKKKRPRPFDLHDLHPYLERKPRGIPIKAGNIRDLKRAFIGGK